MKNMKKMHSTAKGFTLIELMIVVAIIGILAAIALPAYQDYVQRTKVSGAAIAMSSYKTGVSLCFANLGALANCTSVASGTPPVGAEDIPRSSPADNGVSIAYVNGASVGANGVITANTTGRHGDGSPMVLVFTPLAPAVGAGNGNIDWNITGNGCKIDRSDTASAVNNRGIDCSGT